MRAGRILRRLIMDRIIDQVPAFEGRVYDKAVEDTPVPYVTMGASYGIDDDAECIEARLITVQVDIWDSARDETGDVDKGVCEDLTDDVAAALKGWADTDALTMHPLRVTLVRVMDDPDGVSVHGVVQVEADIEDDS